MLIRSVSALVIAVSFGSVALAANYKIDQSHSTVGFSVKHLMISNVKGKFNDFSGEFSFDPKTGTLSAKDFVVKAASIDTANAKRDEHLRSPDFFDSGKCAELKVSNSKVTKTGDKKYDWSGDLTMHCVTKPVKFDVEFLGAAKDPWGHNVVSFEAKSKIKRADWGLKWNKALEAGGVTVGEEVAIELAIEATEDAAKEAAKPATK